MLTTLAQSAIDTNLMLAYIFLIQRFGAPIAIAQFFKVASTNFVVFSTPFAHLEFGLIIAISFRCDDGR